MFNIISFSQKGLHPCNEGNGWEICWQSPYQIAQKQLEGSKCGCGQKEEQREEEAGIGLN